MTGTRAVVDRAFRPLSQAIATWAGGTPRPAATASTASTVAVLRSSSSVTPAWPSGRQDADGGRKRSPIMPPSTASAVPVVALASGLAR